MIDEEIRALERVDWRDPSYLRNLMRLGSPHVCVFCGHAVDGTGQPCSYRPEYEIGEPVRAVGGFVGNYEGHGRVRLTHYGQLDVGLRSDAQHIVFQPYAVIELPDAWRPEPCGCLHAELPPQRTREQYERERGLDVDFWRAMTTMRRAPIGLGSILYDSSQHNADGSPWRWRVNGQPKFWKRSPKRFRVPLKRGMYNFGGITEQYCGLFTQEEWAK